MNFDLLRLLNSRSGIDYTRTSDINKDPNRSGVFLYSVRESYL